METLKEALKSLSADINDFKKWEYAEVAALLKCDSKFTKVARHVKIEELTGNEFLSADANDFKKKLKLTAAEFTFVEEFRAAIREFTKVKTLRSSLPPSVEPPSKTRKRRRPTFDPEEAAKAAQVFQRSGFDLPPAPPAASPVAEKRRSSSVPPRGSPVRKRARRQSTDLRPRSRSSRFLISYSGKRTAFGRLADLRRAVLEIIEPEPMRLMKNPKNLAKVTHLIVGPDQTRPTLKILYALVSGAFLLTEDFVTASVEAESWPAGRHYEHGSWPSREERTNATPPLADCMIHLAGTFAPPSIPKVDLQALIERAGGNICSNARNADVVVLADRTGKLPASITSLLAGGSPQVCPAFVKLPFIVETIATWSRPVVENFEPLLIRELKRRNHPNGEPDKTGKPSEVIEIPSRSASRPVSISASASKSATPAGSNDEEVSDAVSEVTSKGVEDLPLGQEDSLDDSDEEDVGEAFYTTAGGGDQSEDF